MDATWLYNSIMQVIFIITALVSMKSLTEMITQLVGQGDALKDGADTAKEVAKKAGQTAAIAAGGAGLAIKGARVGASIGRGAVGAGKRLAGSQSARLLKDKVTDLYQTKDYKDRKKEAKSKLFESRYNANIAKGMGEKEARADAHGYVNKMLAGYSGNKRKISDTAPAQAVIGFGEKVGDKVSDLGHWAAGTRPGRAAVLAGQGVAHVGGVVGGKVASAGSSVYHGGVAIGQKAYGVAAPVVGQAKSDLSDFLSQSIADARAKQFDKETGKFDKASLWAEFSKSGQEFNKLWGSVSGISGFYKQMESDDAIIGGDEGKMHQFMKDFFKFENDKEKAIKASNAQADRTAAGAAKLTAEEFMERMGSTTLMPDGTTVRGLNNVTLNANNVSSSGGQTHISGDAKMQVTNTPKVKLEAGTEIKMDDTTTRKLTDAINNVNATSANIVKALEKIEDKLP